MPSPSHDLLVLALREEPGLLGSLVEKLTGRRLAPGLRADDSVVRFARTAEVRPDLVLRGRGGRWVLVEIQQRIDRAKQRRWALAASILFDQHRSMGDVVVVTTSPAVARWARTAVRARGALGTRFALEPLVLLVDRSRIDLLLDGARPALALFAVWALRSGRSARARALLVRALQVSAKLAPPLRGSQVRAILDMVGEPMNEFLKKLAKHPELLPMSRGLRQFEAALEARGEARGRVEGVARGRVEGEARGRVEGEARGRAEGEARGRAEGEARGRAEGEAKGRAEGEARGRAEGKRDALLALCEARGLRLRPAERRRVLSCADLRTLDRWIQRAAVAGSSEHFLTVRRGNGARIRGPRKRARRATG